MHSFILGTCPHLTFIKLMYKTGCNPIVAYIYEYITYVYTNWFPKICTHRYLDKQTGWRIGRMLDSSERGASLIRAIYLHIGSGSDTRESLLGSGICMPLLGVIFYVITMVTFST